MASQEMLGTWGRLPPCSWFLGRLAWDIGLCSPFRLPAPTVLCFLQKVIGNTRIVR